MESSDDGNANDYHMEVANTGFGDMLHDYERNQKYFAALRKTIAEMHAVGMEAHVLDIGTGTGILSMMAVTAGADSVTACEVFMPMANCAERIIAANGMAAQIRLIKKRSTDIVIGNGADEMRQRANVLVTEVLDTELIGEGAIAIYNHAHRELLTEDVRCIPARAHCYVQVVQSPLAAQWNSLKSLVDLDGEILLQPPDDVLQCKGEAAALHDVQLSQLPRDKFQPLTEAVKIFDFDFSSKRPLALCRQLDLKLQTRCGGSTDLVFYWWDIEMSDDGAIELSCAPFWLHPDFKAQSVQVLQAIEAGMPLANSVPWRDHWMQAIYYIPRPLHLKAAGGEFVLKCYHDEYSLWFDAAPSPSPPQPPQPRHACSCQLHMSYSRSRIGQLNQPQRNKKYLRYLEDRIERGKSKILTLGDGCMLGLAAAKLGAAKVLSHEPHRFSRQFMKMLAMKNNLENVEFIEQLGANDDDDGDGDGVGDITHVFAEPYFMHSILPWDNLCFGSLFTKMRHKLPANVEISPRAAQIYAVPVEFLDLHRIRLPVGRCENFDLTIFDRMVEESTALALSNIEAHPLWEYPCRALAEPTSLIAFDFKDFEQAQENRGQIKIEHAGSCNGIALWIDWQLDDSPKPKSIVSTGPLTKFQAGEFVTWDMFVRQGVHLLPQPKIVAPRRSRVSWRCQFEPKKTQLEFDFVVVECDDDENDRKASNIQKVTNDKISM